MRKIRSFRLYLVDKTVVLPNVQVQNTDYGIRLITNPLTIEIRPVKLLGVCAFDRKGIIGRVTKLPSFMWRMLR